MTQIGFRNKDSTIAFNFLPDINECSSSPCTYGSTCIDGIGEYRCICPPGRTGAQCQEVEGQSPSPMSCLFNRRIYPDRTTWEHECNLCTCTNGAVHCSKVCILLCLLITPWLKIIASLIQNYCIFLLPIFLGKYYLMHGGIIMWTRVKIKPIYIFMWNLAQCQYLCVYSMRNLYFKLIKFCDKFWRFFS